MTNVTRNNFEELLPEILSSIENSEFIAIDTEFTGLHFQNDSYNSLFDTPQDRYIKLRETTTKFTICQLGLSAFVKVPNENKYVAHTYNFYLFPRSCSTIDARFACQTSSIQFLCQYGFDFNKLFYEGVSYITSEEEKELRQQAKEGASKLLSDVNEDLIKSCSSIISEWLPDAKEGDQINMAKIPDDMLSLQMQILLRNCFQSIWTSQVDTGEIVITKVSPEERNKLLQAESSLTERLLDQLVGFSKVFKRLCELKKPVIGHNLLTDLLFLYSKFYKRLPDKWKDLKVSMRELLPHIYDTKHLILRIRRQLDELGLPLTSTSLETVYRVFHGNRGKFLVLHSPGITLAENSSRYRDEESFHEAGFDAYLAGYVFLRMAHYLTAKDTRSMDSKPLLFKSYLPVMAAHENKVNVIRASIPYVDLSGADPISNRPKYLYVTARGATHLHAGELAATFERYTSVDIKLIDRRHAMLAASTYGGSKDILRAFKNDQKVKIVQYNVFQHSKAVRYSLWGAVAVMGAVSLWALLGDQSKKS